MPIPAIHPGEHLAEELEALDMSAAKLARNIGVPTNRVTQILHGTRSITGDTCASPISSALARSSGSISKISTTCAWPRRKPANPSKPSPG